MGERGARTVRRRGERSKGRGTGRGRGSRAGLRVVGTGGRGLGGVSRKERESLSGVERSDGEDESGGVLSYTSMWGGTDTEDRQGEG